MLQCSDFKNKKITIMGLGLHGGGVASAEFFANCGAGVTVTDMKTEAQLQPSLEKLARFKNIRYVLGKHELSDFETADIVIKNPGVKSEGNPFLAAAKKIESDISIFCQLSSAPIIAVTGSKGKSSTVSAIHYGLQKAGCNSFLGGNITVSPLTFLDRLTSTTPVVLELSSWQLSDLKHCTAFKPHIAVITPIVPDHQNWYHNMQEYVADKKIIYKNQTCNDYTVCNADDEWGHSCAAETAAQVCYYGAASNILLVHPDTPCVYFDDELTGYYCDGKRRIKLLPAKTHMLTFPQKQNLLNASLVLMLHGIPAEIIPAIMQEYKGLEHRLEFFYEANQVQFFNDTTATVPEATISALHAFNGKDYTPPILIAGGTNKNLHFEKLGQEARSAAAVFLLAGTATELLQTELTKNNVSFHGPYASLQELLSALKVFLEKHNYAAVQNKKCPVIFSPAAASFGMFAHEFDRGNKFKELVKKMF